MTDTTFPTINQRYTLDTKLGQGGMGSVYRTYDRLTRQMVALKQVSVPTAILQFATSSSDPTLSLALEFRALAGLRHPHIVAVLDYGFDAQRYPYYTMQLLEHAQPITDYGQALDERGKVRLLIEMLQALVYLHRRGVIHRDLKPANVLVSQSGSIQVMDFGLALQHDASAQFGSGVMGTLAYMAPELFSEMSGSTASDLYAVGVMMYELFAGTHPFASDNGTPMLSHILTREADVSTVPPRLAPLVARLLAKTPDQRPQRAEEVIAELCAATDTPPPAETLTLRESFLQASAFVGRETEFATLRQALSNMLQGSSSFWLVGGESGVGKSRLIDELRTRALVNGALVLRGQAVAEGGLPYQLWRDVIRHLALDTRLSDLEAGILKPLVPDIAALLEREVPDAPDLPGGAGEQRLVLTLIDLFKRQERPLAVLLEDLQWAEESLAPLRQMLEVRDQLTSLLVIGTYRDDEHPTLPQDLQGVQVLRLPRLSAEAVAQLAHVMLGEAGEQPAVVDLLRRETEGNVFFLVETVRALAEEAGTLAAIGQATLPSAVFAGGVQRIVQRRLNRLPQPFRPLLERAAVAGRMLDVQVLGHLAAGVEVETFLAAGTDASIFEVSDGVWRFSHDKLREGVLAALTADEHRTLHRVVAEALEASYLGDTAYHEVLLEHWREAQDTERELLYLIPVAERLVRIGNEYARVDQLIMRGLALVGGEAASTASLLNLRSRSWVEQAQYPGAQQAALEALTLAQRFDNKAEIADSLYNLGNVAIDQGNYAAAEDYYQQSLALSHEIGNKNGVANSLNNLGNVAYNQGNYPAAADYYEQSLALRRMIGDKRGIAASLYNLGNVAYFLGNYVATEDYLQQSLALSREIGYKLGIAFCLYNLGNVAYFLGNYAAAEEYYQQSLTLSREIGNKNRMVHSLYNLGMVTYDQGNSANAQDYLQQSLALGHEIGSKSSIVDSLNGLGMVTCDQGSYADAEDFLQQSLALGHEIGSKSSLAYSLFYLGTNAHHQGNFLGAEDYYQQSLAISREISHKPVLVDGLAELCVLRLEQGDEQVIPVMREGLGLSLEIGARPALLRFLVTLARLLARDGHTTEAARLAGLVEGHPAITASLRRRGLAKLKRELQSALRPDDLDTAMAQGRTLELETMAREQWARLDDATTDS